MTVIRMTSLTGRFPKSPAQSVSREGNPGNSESPVPLAFLYRDWRWCANCGGEQVFVPCFEIEAGRVGFCMGCGEEKFVAWTRANSEVA